MYRLFRAARCLTLHCSTFTWFAWFAVSFAAWHLGVLLSKTKRRVISDAPMKYCREGLLVAVVLRLVWAFHRHAEVVGLFLGELGELHADAFQVQTGDFFVQFLGQTIDADFVRVAVLPQVQLREASGW